MDTSRPKNWVIVRGLLSFLEENTVFTKGKAATCQWEGQVKIDERLPQEVHIHSKHPHTQITQWPDKRWSIHCGRVEGRESVCM